MAAWEEKTPIATIDVLVLTIEDNELKIAFIQRDKAPEEGELALIGGWVHTEEDVSDKDVVDRILETKAGLKGVYTEQLFTFMGKDRDPRGWSVSVAYMAFLPLDVLKAKAASNVVLRPVSDTGPLAFDHEQIVAKAVARLRAKGAYSTLPARFLPKLFTMRELHRVYEAVLGEINFSHFRRRVLEEDGMLQEMPQSKTSGGRPAVLYRLKARATEFDSRLATPKSRK